MNETVRGLVVFVSALVTLALWAPLSSSAQRAGDGAIITDLYFGLLRYLTVQTRLKEPEHSIRLAELNIERLAATAVATILLWFLVIRFLRRSRLAAEGSDGSQSQ